MSISGNTQKIGGVWMYLYDWKPNQVASGPVTSVQRAIRLTLKAPVDAQEVYYKVGYPYSFLTFSFLGSEFEVRNAAGLTSLQAEDNYEGIIFIQFRKEDGALEDCSAVANFVHIYNSNGNRWKFIVRVQKFDSGIDNTEIQSLAN